ncbi:bifunctional 2',3'-cyclic-nucleotide 2'-phosphodiesterase/3'-nucleotidase [Streptococcus hongkongensis]|nr:2', 3'-cyclic nucleotide 2'-phosphodiesterase [Streptococcus uberis]
MKKHFVSKSAIFLSMIVAAGTAHIVSAEVSSSSNSQPETTAIKPLATSPVAADANTTTASPTPLSSVPVEKAAIAAPMPTTTATPTATVSDTMAMAPVEGQNVDVRIVSTTDLHSNLINYDYYQDKPSQTIGLAKAAVLIDQAKRENPNTVLVDNGDILQGTPLGTYTALIDPIQAGEVHPMYAALDKLGFDASTLGNHEFNYGLAYLNRVIASAGLPIVNANVYDATTGNYYFKPYEVITKTFTDTNGQAVNLKIGITGIVPPQIMGWDKANLTGKVTVTDAVQAVEKILPQMRQAGADITLVLAHTGIGDNVYEVGEENVGYQIASLPGVDAVVTGHSHAEFPSGQGTGSYESYTGVDGVAGLINGTPTNMAGKYGDHIGVIDLNVTYTNGQWVVNKNKNHSEIRKIDTKSTLADPDIVTLAQEAHNGTVDYVRQTVGQTTSPINSYFALVKDDPSVQIVNKAQLWYAAQQLAGTPEANLPLLSAAAPFKAGTRNDPTAYTDIPAGPIAIKNVADLYLYDNVTAILKVTGADLKEWLEMSAGQFNTIDPTNTGPQNLVNTDYRTYNFDVIDGLTYEFDITQANKYDAKGNLVNPDANRVKNLMYQGKAIDPNQEFMIVTNNYRASSTFPGAKNARLNRLLNLENRQAIINYIISEKTINPSADNNWYFTDSIKGLNLHFLSADKAQHLIGDKADISYVGPSTVEGFGDFVFTYVKPVVPTDKAPAPTENTSTISPATRAEMQALAARVYQETHQPTQLAAKAENLPTTGSKESQAISLFGLAFLSLGALFTRKNRRQN